MKATLETMGGVILAGPEMATNASATSYRSGQRMGPVARQCRKHAPHLVRAANREDLDLPPGDNGCGAGWIMTVLWIAEATGVGSSLLLSSDCWV